MHYSFVAYEERNEPVLHSMTSVNINPLSQLLPQPLPLSPFGNHQQGRVTRVGRRSVSKGLRTPPNKWTKEETEKLCQLVKVHGDKSWKKIAALIGNNKTGAQCGKLFYFPFPLLQNFKFYVI